MKLLFLDQFSEWGGAQLCLRDVLAEVRDRGWGAEVMAPGGGPLMDYARNCGFTATSLPLSRYANGGKTAWDVMRFPVDISRCVGAVRKSLHQRRADLIYVNGPRALSSVWGTGIPVLFHSHSVAGAAYARGIAAFSLRRVRATVLACSSFAARQWANEFEVHVVYNCVADCGYAPRAAQGKPLEVGIVGRIAPEKGQLDFVRAARLLNTTLPMNFTVVGEALFSDPQYERTVRTLGAASSTRFTGWTDDIARALHGLDILAVPSKAVEASTRVIMEAFSAGTCVVAYPAGGIPEIVREGHNGLLTNGCAPEFLARSIQTLVTNPGLRAKLVENGRREWEMWFQMERFQRDVAGAIFRSVTSPVRDARGMRSAGLPPKSASGATPSSR